MIVRAVRTVQSFGELRTKSLMNQSAVKRTCFLIETGDGAVVGKKALDREVSDIAGI